MKLMWTYKGIDVFRADPNSMGIRWYARTKTNGTLRADSKNSMRALISLVHLQNRKIPRSGETAY